MTTKKLKRFRYGNIKLNILEQDNQFVPTEAQEIHLPAEDRKALAIAIRDDIPCLLIGETGTGKTSAVRYLAFRRKQGYTRLNMNGFVTPEDLLGHVSVKNGETYFEYGVLVQAMQRGDIVVADEINGTTQDCLFVIHGLLDEDKRVTLPNGDIIRPHKDFRFFATMNPDYEGTKSLNRAFLDRFGIILCVDILTPKKEASLIVTRTGVENTLADEMVKTAWLGRKAYKEQKALTLISTRSLLQWGTLINEGMKNKDAYTKSVINKARQEEQTAFRDFFNAVFKVDPNSDTQLDAPVLTTQREIRNQEERLKTYEKAVQTKDAEISDLTRKVDTLTSENEEFKTQMEEVKKKFDHIEKLEKENLKLNEKLKSVAKVFEPTEGQTTETS